jgi:hypothetical protein
MSLGDQAASDLEQEGGIHLQEPYRRAANGGLSFDSLPHAREVLLPEIPTRMKKTRQLSGIRVDTRKIGAFVEIAVDASPGEVLGCVRAAMLAGDDVLDVKILRRQNSVRQATVLAAITPAPAYALS